MNSKTRLTSGRFIFFALLFCGVLHTHISLASGEKGFRSYINHEFDAAIEACKNGKDNFSRMVTTLAYAERYGLYKIKEDKIQTKAYLDIIKGNLTLKDIGNIERLLSVKGNPFGLKVAETFLRTAFVNLNSSKEVMIAANFLNADRLSSHNRYALKAIQKFLKQIRNYVINGGTMPKKEKELFSNPKLIQSLVSLLPVKDNGALAKKCLILIEEACLPYLENQPITKSISETIVAVRKAITKRQKKYPSSTWYSATGE